MKLSIYMKSGNTIVLRGVKYWKVGVDGDDVRQLSIEYYRYKPPFTTRLVMNSINLSQIEAITKH